MKIKMDLLRKPGNLHPSTCVVEAVVEVPTEQFMGVLAAPCMGWQFIAENEKKMWSDGEEYHCLLVLGEGLDDGVLVESEGYGYVRYGAYVTGARTLLTDELAHTADIIVKEGIQNTTDGKWHIKLEEVNEMLEMPVAKDNGIGPMLVAALERRPEVAEVELGDWWIHAGFHLDFCKNLSESMQPPESRSQRQERLVNDLLGYFGAHMDQRELFDILHGELEMDAEDAEMLGFDLSDCFPKCARSDQDDSGLAAPTHAAAGQAMDGQSM